MNTHGQYTQSSRNEDNMGRWYFSHWHRLLWGKTPSTPERRRTYDPLVTSPDKMLYPYCITLKLINYSYGYKPIEVPHFGQLDVSWFPLKIYIKITPVSLKTDENTDQDTWILISNLNYHTINYSLSYFEKLFTTWKLQFWKVPSWNASLNQRFFHCKNTLSTIMT